jgi:hypothetical protein
MLYEVDTEATLDTRRAHVRRVLLDPRAVDANHVGAANLEIELTAYATVRAHAADCARGLLHGVPRELRQRQHIVDGAGWADADALTTPRASGMLRIAICSDDDLGVIAAIRDIEHTHDLNVRACAHASRAEDARGHVVLDHRIASPIVAGAKRQPGAVLHTHGVMLHHPLELVLRALLCNVLGRISLEQHAEYGAPVLDRGMRLGRHFHPIGGGSGARCGELRPAFH